MALTFTENYGLLLKDMYEGGDWDVVIFGEDPSGYGGNTDLDVKSATATWDPTTKTATLATNLKFSIGEGVTIKEIHLKENNLIIAREVISGGYYQYGGILEITSLRIEHEYTISG